MAQDESAGGVTRRTRRDVVRMLGAGGALALAGCDGDGGTATPTPDLQLLLATSTSGEYDSVGTFQKRGFDLAVSHINEGGGLVDDAFDDLDGDGLLGRDVVGLTEDTENSPDTTRSAVTRFLEGDEVTMMIGGVGTGVVNALSDLGAEHDVPYMAGTTPDNNITGGDCQRTTFRVQPYARAIMNGLGPVLTESFPEDTSFAQLSSEASEGQVLKTAVGEYFRRDRTPNWSTQGSESVRPGTGDMESVVQNVTLGRPDVIFLNLFGLDAINALRAVRSIHGSDIGVVVPLIDDSLGRELEDAVEGVYGTIPWDLGVGSAQSETFDQAYVDEYGTAGGGSAWTGAGTGHVTYTETLLYAAAVERAGSLDTDAVVAELEGTTYDVGLGNEELRACDHQATRPVVAVHGVAGRTADSNRFEVVNVANDAVGSCDETPASDCSF